MIVRGVWVSAAVVIGGIVACAAVGQDTKSEAVKADAGTQNTPTIPTMADLAWIAGDWVSTNDNLRYTVTETWSAPFHETMTGVARTVVMKKGENGGPAKGEVVSVRSMIIRPRPDGLPVLFMRRMNGTLEDFPGLGAAFYPLMEWSKDSCTFSNDGQTSPRTIAFAKMGPDAIRITYTGVQPGTHQLRSQPTDFRARFAVEPDEPLIARAMLFRSLLHAGEYDAARAMMSENPRRWFEVREGEGQEWTVGKRSGPWARWDTFFRKRTEVVDWTAGEDSASLTFRETNDYFRLLSRGWATNRVTYFFDDQRRISGMLIEALGERPPGDTAEFLAWARAHHADELEALMPDGKIDPSGDHPERMRVLLDEWRTAAGLPAVE